MVRTDRRPTGKFIHLYRADGHRMKVHEFIDSRGSWSYQLEGAGLVVQDKDGEFVHVPDQVRLTRKSPKT